MSEANCSESGDEGANLGGLLNANPPTETPEVTVDDLLAAMEEIKQAEEKPWLAFFAENGGDFERGDILMLPIVEGVDIPDGLKEQIKMSEFIAKDNPLFINGDYAKKHLGI